VLLPLDWSMKVWTRFERQDREVGVGAGWRCDPRLRLGPSERTRARTKSRLQKIAKDGISIKDIESFCEGMQKLTKDSLKTDGRTRGAARRHLPGARPEHLSDYIKKTAERTGIDAFVLEAALDDVPGNS